MSGRKVTVVIFSIYFPRPADGSTLFPFINLARPEPACRINNFTMKNFYVLLALLPLLLMGCSKEDGADGGGQAVQLATGTTNEYTVYADETAVAPSQGITFTTTGPWRATVAETRAGADWVTISPDHGDQAGSYTITVSLEANTTGQDRKAVVTIECGDTRVTITIEQKGVTASGEQPQEPVLDMPRVSRFETAYFYYDGTTVVSEETSAFDCLYDETGRLSQIVSNGVNEVRTMTLTYGPGEVSYAVVLTENGVEDPHSDKGTATLDEAGRVASGKYFYTYEKNGEWISGSFTYQLAYDADGCLVGCESSSSEPGTSHITWENGNPVQVRWGVDNNLIDKATYGNVANGANIDLNWLCVLTSEGWDYSVGDPNKFFALAGLVGKRATHMVSTISESGAGPAPRLSKYNYILDDATGLPVEISRVTTDYGSTKEYVDYTCKIEYVE